MRIALSTVGDRFSPQHIGKSSHKCKSSLSSFILLMMCFGKLSVTLMLIWVVVWNGDFFFPPFIWFGNKASHIYMNLFLITVSDCEFWCSLEKWELGNIYSLLGRFMSQNPGMLALIIKKITRNLKMVVKNWNNQRWKIG